MLKIINTKNLEERVIKLRKSKFFLECFYLYSVIIEQNLQRAIKFQEDWIEIILKRNKLGYIKSDFKKQTLGQLISIFSKHCNDHQLISQLKNFNSFRIILTHKILDNKIEILNNEARKKIGSYYELLIKLHNYNIRILEKLFRHEKRKGERERKI